jgi:GNAT superfamily N-acetyltransferase
VPGETLFEAASVRVAVLDADDGPDLEQLFARCDDFFALVMGHPPGPAEVQSAFVALHEGKSYGDKILAGVIADDGLAGEIDLVRDYPEDGTWHIGSFLLDPAHRDDARSVYEALEAWAGRGGARRLRIIVANQDREAVAFWTGLGFEIRDTVTRRQGLRDNTCHVMVRELGAR